jgi:predicted Zn-dependent protease
MIRKSNSRRLATAVALWLSAAAGGCHLPDLPPLKWPEPPVPDVHPILKDRNDEAVRDFDERRNAAQYLAAQTSWRQGDYGRCREALEKVLDRDPNHRGALLLSADVALETENPQDAIDLLRRALAADAHDAEVAYRLGLALETAGAVAEAVPYLRQAAAADPANQQYAAALTEAEGQLNGENTTAAAETPPPPVITDEAQPLSDASPVKAAPAPEAEVKADPEFAAALVDWEANRVVECANRLTKILARDQEHVEANILQAEIELNGGQTAAALRRMDRLVLAHPRDFQVRQACGLVNEAAGNVEKANHFFQEAESLAEADALVTVAYQEPISGKTATEVDAVAIAAPTPVESEVLNVPDVPQLQNLPNERLPQDAAALLGDGQAALQSGKITDARRMLKTAVARSNDGPHTAVTASIAALKLEQPELALELSAAGAASFPRSAALHRIRGMAAYRLGKYAEAESSLRQSLNLDNSQALSYFLLGSAQSRLGKTEEAKRNLREAARLDARYAQRK